MCEQGHDAIVIINGVTVKVERSWRGKIAVQDAFGKVNLKAVFLPCWDFPEM